MELLKTKILQEGKSLKGNVLKVDSFINHQMDIGLFNEIGKEFKRRFSNKNITKILTIESSGIAIAAITSQYFNNVPVIFAKKYQGSNMDGEAYESEVYSFTKNTTYRIRVSKKYLSEEDEILIIDDFLADGNAALGLIDIVNQSKAKVTGIGIVIEKGFQKGRSVLEKRGIQLESIAIVDSLENGQILFKG